MSPALTLTAGAAGAFEKRKFDAVGTTGTAPLKTRAALSCAGATASLCVKFPCRKCSDETLVTALYCTFLYTVTLRLTFVTFVTNLRP